MAVILICLLDQPLDQIILGLPFKLWLIWCLIGDHRCCILLMCFSCSKGNWCNSLNWIHCFGLQITIWYATPQQRLRCRCSFSWSEMWLGNNHIIRKLWWRCPAMHLKLDFPWIGNSGFLQGPDPCQAESCPLFSKAHFKAHRKKQRITRGTSCLIQYVTAFGHVDAGRAQDLSEKKYFCIGWQHSTELMPSQPRVKGENMFFSSLHFRNTRNFE